MIMIHDNYHFDIHRKKNLSNHALGHVQMGTSYFNMDSIESRKFNTKTQAAAKYILGGNFVS